MRKLLIVLSLLALSASAFAADPVRWTFVGNTGIAFTGGYTVDFPSGFNVVNNITAVLTELNPFTGGENWVENMQTIPAGTPSVFSVTFSGLNDTQLSKLDDLIMAFYTYDESGNFVAVQDLPVERDGSEVQVFFTPENDIAGIVNIALNFNPSIGGPFDGVSITDILVKEVKEEPESDTEIPEPAAFAYAAMGLASAFGLKRRIKK
ncbi:MAG: hypothetical protein J6X53_02155 [Abditibacteriota bacterium]|nr:hypothetical protein [Abditibacteriota bacterium]